MAKRTAAQKTYIKANPYCEMCEHIPLTEPTWQMVLSQHRLKRVATDVHHVWMGRRDDHPTNLLALSKVLHRHWIPLVGNTVARILGIWVKVRKGEFDLDEMRRIAGTDIRGWLENVSYEFSGVEQPQWVEEMRLSLLEGF